MSKQKIIFSFRIDDDTAAYLEKEKNMSEVVNTAMRDYYKKHSVSCPRCSGTGKILRGLNSVILRKRNLSP